MNKLHLFNIHGVSIMTMEHMEKRISDLEKENALLKRQLKAAVKKISGISETAKSEISFH